MKRSILAAYTLVVLTITSYAGVTMSNFGVGSSASFPTYSISGVNGTLAFQDVGASPSGVTIQGGASQGPVAPGTGWGEIFNWTGGAVTLSAISIIDNGGNGFATYQPFLFDLGTTIFNTPSSVFNPSLHLNLLSSVTLQPPPLGSANFLEFDFSGADAIKLTTGDSYAFGLIHIAGTNDLSYQRSSGAQSDPNRWLHPLGFECHGR